MTIYDIELDIEEKLTKKRFTHTLGVSYIASALSMNYSLNVENARIAGLLHDCAKWMNDDEMLLYCQKKRIEVSEFERMNPSLLHGKIGSFIAKETYQIEDIDILNAISSHTTGHPNMSKLEQIIYISDYIEPNRKELNRIDFIRTIAFKDLDLAMYYITEDTLIYLRSTNKVIDTKTEETYNFYKEKYLCLQNSNN